ARDRACVHDQISNDDLFRPPGAQMFNSGQNSPYWFQRLKRFPARPQNINADCWKGDHIEHIDVVASRRLAGYG
ncbi:MAG: hypothetical protein WA777_14185, partial [Rhodanobacter sp.]